MEMVENYAEIILEKVEEEQMGMPSDDESDSGENTPWNLNFNQKKVEQGFARDTEVDSESWRLEMERVLPQLKVIIRADPRDADWRAHLEQIKTLQKEIESVRDQFQSLSRF